MRRPAVASPGGLVDKYVYDGAGRVTTSYLSDGGGDSGYSDAGTVTGDTVLEQDEHEPRQQEADEEGDQVPEPGLAVEPRHE